MNKKFVYQVGNNKKKVYYLQFPAMSYNTSYNISIFFSPDL